MWDNYIKGETVILSIQVGGIYMPAACVTSMPFNKSTGRMETGGRGSGGYRTYLPTLHDYDLSFSGIVTKQTGVVSYNDLDFLQDNRIVFKWQILSEDNHIAKSGDGFITGLSLTTDANTWCGFNCTLSPGVLGSNNILLWSQDGFNVVQDGNNNLIQV